MAESHGESTSAHTEADGGHGGAFPPFEASTFASQLVSLAIAFVALYLIVSRIALLCYWSNVLIFGVVLHVSWFHASRAGRKFKRTPADVQKAVSRRIVVAQASARCCAS